MRYLAKSFSNDDLAFGIKWVLNAENYDELCINAREKVVKEFLMIREDIKKVQSKGIESSDIFG